MIRYYRYFIIFWVILAAAGSVNAQNFYYKLYTVNDGLAQSTVYSLMQDNRGLLWVGTVGGGINIYDGVRFKNLTSEDGLAGNIIYSMVQDYSGNVWVGTDKGLSKITGKNITNFGVEEGLPNASVFSLKVAPDSSIWIGTAEGLAVYNNNKIQQYETYPELKKVFTYCIFFDSEKNVWLGTKGNGVFRISKSGIRNFTTKDSLGYMTVRTINEDKNGLIWIGTDKSFNAYTNGSLKYESRATSTLTSSFVDQEGQVWMLSYNEWLSKNIMGDNGRFALAQYYKLQGFSLLTSILDREGNVWVGSETGLIKIPPSPFINYNENTGFKVSNVSALCNGISRAATWIGFTKSGVSVLNDMVGKGVYTILANYSYQTSPGIIGSTVYSLMHDSHNCIWIGTNQGISRFNEVDSVFVNYSNDSSRIKDPGFVHVPFVNNAVFSLAEDQSGQIWVGTYKGIFILTDSSHVNFGSQFPEIAGEMIYSLLFAGRESLWICTRNGLFYYNGINLKKFTEADGFIEGQVNTAVKDSYDNIWLATKEGVFCYNGSSFAKIDKTKGLASNVVYSLILDSKQNLFIGTNNGLDRINTIDYHRNGEIKVKHYGGAEGFMGVECNLNAVMKDSLGRLWFGTVDGVTIYDPRFDIENTVAPNTYINKVLLNFQDFDWTPYCSHLDSVTGLPVDLVLPYNLNHLTFDFASNSLSIPEKVRYQYMLEGVDADWSPQMAKNEADYPFLPYGKYTFKVRSCNNDGVWSESPTLFTFEITPPFYMTWWFIVSAAVVALFLVFAYMKFREAKLKKEKLVLENKVQERTVEITRQKEIVEQKNKDITDSINYAKNIQEALLPGNTEISDQLPNSFIIYRPRDIVSGDFYWMSQRGGRTFFVIADCTGHGVPGAFMSLLGIAFLDEIVGNNSEISASELLNQLRENVIISLHQTGKTGESKDGMDLSLIIVDWSKREMQWAGANNPLYLVRNNYINEYKADKMPIGFHPNPAPFTNHVISLFPGDTVYLFSDGYADQFGGPQGKKFKYKALKELILQNSYLDMSRQKQVFEKAIIDWMQGYEQIDDILIAGVRFDEATLAKNSEH